MYQNLLKRASRLVGAALTVFAVSAGSLNAQVNPIAQFYGNGNYPTWTDDIKWSNVVNMATYANGNNDFEKFENARDQLATQGGGVLYYPAGIYNFSNHPTGPQGRGLMLRKGVVILGDAPTTDVNATVDSANPGLSALPTKFIFPFLTRATSTGGTGEYPDAWNCIGLMPEPGETIRNVDKVGIAWVNLDGAYAYMGPDMPWGSTWGSAGAWRSALAKNTGENWASRVPDGTHFMDPFMGAAPDLPYFGGSRGRFIFGCRFDNSACSNYMASEGTGAAYDPDFLFNFRFAARITVYGGNVFIANNALPRATKNFQFNQTIKARNTNPVLGAVNFDYGYQIGIDVNKQLVSQRNNRCSLTDGPYFEPGVIIKDNWVFNHGNKGYEFCGKWTSVINNVNNREYLGSGSGVYGLPTAWTLTRDGYNVSNQIDDNMSRAMDFGGWNLWLHKNWYDNTGSNPGNDGEGLLIQRHGAVEAFSFAYTYNGQGPNGETGYLAPYDVHCLGLLHFKNRQRGAVGIMGADRNGNVSQDISAVENINRQGQPSSISGVGVTQVADFLSVCPTTTPNPPLGLTITPDSVLRAMIVEWSDNSFDEVGFRVDRRIQGTTDWKTIAYRPRNETGGSFVYPGRDNGGAVTGCQNNPMTDFNEQKWYDFEAPAYTNLEYRVIAVNCADNDAATTAPTVPTAQLTAANRPINALDMVGVFPIPARDMVNYQFYVNKPGTYQMVVTDMLGRKVFGQAGKFENGYQKGEINLKGLPTGTYRLLISGEGFKSVQPITVE